MQFLKDAIFLNLEDFGGGNLPIGLILMFFFVGLIIATVVSQLFNAVIYRGVQALIRHKATAPESAKTLKALGLSEDRMFLRVLKGEGAMLKRFFAVAEDADAEEKETAPEGENTAEKGEKTPLEASYYLAPAYADRAKQIISESEPTLLRAIGYCLLLAAIYFLIALMLPWLLPLVM
jgi:hypothetical protein